MPVNRLRALASCVPGWLLLLWCLAARAHPMPESLVWIDTTPAGLQLTAQLPLNRLEFGFGQALRDDPATLLARHGAALGDYLLMHVGVRSPAGSWQVLRPRLAVTGEGATAELQAVFAIRAPPGAGADAGTGAGAPVLVYDVITHEVRTHRVQVFLRNDWRHGFAGQPPLLLGELRFGRNSLPLALNPTGSSSVARLFFSGMTHIAEGADHLLFLLMLVLAAPLQARRGRWRGLRAPRAALRHIGLVITAFTAGHTLTLIGGSAGWLNVPAQPIEVAVAFTIAVAALHVWRPLFARAEAGMALGFGLVHGMAFSASLSGAGLSAWQHAQALLAFNLGIEAMQMMAVALVLPPIWLLGRRRPDALTLVRRSLAAMAGMLACAWIVQRLGWLDLDALGWLGDGSPAPLLIVAALWLLALGASGHGRRAALVR